MPEYVDVKAKPGEVVCNAKSPKLVICCWRAKGHVGPHCNAFSSWGQKKSPLDDLARFACDEAFDRELASHLHAWDASGDRVKDAWREVVAQMLVPLADRIAEDGDFDRRMRECHVDRRNGTTDGRDMIEHGLLEQTSWGWYRPTMKARFYIVETRAKKTCR